MKELDNELYGIIAGTINVPLHSNTFVKQTEVLLCHSLAAAECKLVSVKCRCLMRIMNSSHQITATRRLTIVGFFFINKLCYVLPKNLN